MGRSDIDGHPGLPPRQMVRRLIIAVVVATQLTMVVLAYGSAHPVFGFQMFPETSEWQAEIVRVTDDETAIDVRDSWPGGYSWPALVQGRGLGDPFRRHPADAGIDSTLDFLAHALDWVAANTPDDPDTRYLEARVTYWQNGRGPSHVILRSEYREIEG